MQAAVTQENDKITLLVRGIKAVSNMLSSWKEIAQFFGKGVRTVQRWEKTLDLPIHRPPGAPSNVVLAKESDLEAWMNRGLVGGHVVKSSNVSTAVEMLQKSIEELSRNRSASDFQERVADLRDRLNGLEHALAEVEQGRDGNHGSIAA